MSPGLSDYVSQHKGIEVTDQLFHSRQCIIETGKLRTIVASLEEPFRRLLMAKLWPVRWQNRKNGFDLGIVLGSDHEPYRSPSALLLQ
jgi:hypothetical protein